MNDLSYTSLPSFSDEAIEKEIGLYIKKMRQQQNRTQGDVAKAANISRSTLSLLERGESGNLKTLIQILRVLDKLHVLGGFKYEEPLSPMALAKSQYKLKERVRPYKKSKKATSNKKSSW